MKKYETEIQESVLGEAFFTLPEELLHNLEWGEGDELKFIDNKDGSFKIKKVKYEAVELEFTDDELLKYMTLAHENRMSFNEWIENTLKHYLNEIDSE